MAFADVARDGSVRKLSNFRIGNLRDFTGCGPSPRPQEQQPTLPDASPDLGPVRAAAGLHRRARRRHDARRDLPRAALRAPADQRRL